MNARHASTRPVLTSPRRPHPQNQQNPPLQTKLLHPPHPGLVQSRVSRFFIPVARRLRSTVVARRDARVRDQQHGRAVRGQHPMREKQTFFGDFLPFSKKLPAPWSGSFGSKTSTSKQTSKAKSLDSRFRVNDERIKRKSAAPHPLLRPNLQSTSTKYDRPYGL